MITTANDGRSRMMDEQSKGVEAMVVPHGVGKPLHVMGHSATIKLAQDVTGGAYYTFDLVSPPGMGIPPHVHSHEDEVILVQESQYAVILGDKRFQAGPGAILHFPRGVPHGFQNVGDIPGKTVWMVTPGANFETFFEELAALPTDAPPDLAKVAALFAQYGMQILPPPA